jgi:uncharacterized cupredoxin-like copper-binding protein
MQVLSRIAKGWSTRLYAAVPALALLTVAGSARDGEPPARAVADTTITIRTVGANLAFEPDRISLKHGLTVRVRYVNESTLGHNFVIVHTDDDIDVLGKAAHEAAGTGYVPMQHKDRIIGYSPLASPGQTVEFTFVVPPPGEYPFVCLVDGHYNMMVGTLRSRP